MNQSFKILIKQQLFESTTSKSGLDLNNGYYSYDEKGLNKGIVTEFNVRQFLDDPKNQDVAIGFFNYLNESSTTEEISEINESNKKISDLFKKYYNTSVLFNLKSPTSFIDQELILTSSSTVNDYYRYNLVGTTVIESQTGTPATLTSSTQNSINSERDELISYTNDESYYLPINIKLTNGESTILNFISTYSLDDIKEFIEDGEQKSIFLKQGFVILNKETNQNSHWK